MNGLLGFPDGIGGGFNEPVIPGDPLIPIVLELTARDMFGDNEDG
jgi:hypothetical protein